MPNSAFITGGAGFIGSHLSRFLLSKGWKVTCLDNLSVGSLENIKDLVTNPKFTFKKADVLNERVLSQSIKKGGVVFHLAATLGVYNIFLHPLETITTDFLGTEVVLRLSQKNGAQKVFFASSSEVYGTNPKIPLREDSQRILGETTNSRWSYAAAKALSEQLCFAYSDKYRLKVTVGRFFNVYGPGCYNKVYRHVITKFVLHALNGHDITIYGTGSQTRSFAFIDDVIKATYLLTQGNHPGVFNVGNPKEVRIIDLAKRIITLTGSKSKIVRINPKKKLGKNFEDILFRKPDIKKLTKSTGFAPGVNLNQGLKATIEYLRGKI